MLHLQNIEDIGNSTVEHDVSTSRTAAFTDSAEEQDMSDQDIFPQFERRLRRAFRLNPVLIICLYVLFVILTIIGHSRSWNIVCILLAIYAHMGLQSLRRRIATAMVVLHNPQLVYWAHPADGFHSILDQPIVECKSVMLHLRNGTQVAIDTSPAEMRNFITWLKERNPSIRLGAYDDFVVYEDRTDISGDKS